MIKNKLDYKLVNMAIIVLIIFLVYRTGNLWIGVTNKILKIGTPFFLAFIVAYAFYPLLKFLQQKKLPKPFAVFLIIALVVGIVAFVGVLVVPMLFTQLSSLFNGIISFIKELSTDYDINLGPLQQTLTDAFNDIIKGLGKYVSSGAMNVIGLSLDYLTAFAIAFSASIYFLIDMDKIRSGVKKYLKRKSKRTFHFVKAVDIEMKNYLTGFMKVVFISLIEYTLAYYIIGHPNALLLGFLAAIANLIPYFGGMASNLIACVTSFVIGPKMFIKNVILFFILSNVDGYVINPFVYGKTNKVHPIIVILSVFAGGILFGIMGIIISLPLAIIIITAYKYYMPAITDKLEDMKEGNKKETI